MSNNFGSHLGREVVVKATKLGAAGTASGVRDLISITPKPQNWMAEGRCRALVEAGEIDPEIFFPEHGKRGEEALAICKVCPVIRDCVKWMLEEEKAERRCHGIVAGLTESQRTRRLHRHGIARKKS